MRDRTLKFPRLATQRTLWVPTLWGWLALLIAAASTLVAATLSIHPFLAANQPVGRGILVVEGWLAEESLLRAIDAYRLGEYRVLVTTGGPIKGIWSRQDRFASFADRAAHFVRAHGVADEEVVTLAAGSRDRNRTWQSARGVQRWFSQSQLEVDALDVFTEGPHGRRSWWLFRRALGERLEIGVRSAPAIEYDQRIWWQTSSGVKAVINEIVGLAWTTCCLEPSSEVSEIQWGQELGRP